MSDLSALPDEIYVPSLTTREEAYISPEKYEELYQRSLADPDGFWAEMAERIDWFKKPTKIKNTSFTGGVDIKWYEDGVLNACYNCVDRHLPARANQTAFIWEGNDPALDKTITYAELKGEVCRLANALTARGIGKGDRVIIYMPMVPEAVYAMLACARIGAIHSVVFGGFSPNALHDRINDCEACALITADEGLRGAKTIPLKNNVDEALAMGAPSLHTVLVLEHTGGPIAWNDQYDIWWHELVDDQPSDAPCAEMNAEDPLFILYTSGSTGKPKGVVHTTGGYMVYASLTHQWVFDYKDGEVYWCAADIGWITGHSYLVYGPLANGATSVMFEGIPNYPDFSRYWQIVDKHQVNIFYTAPTALRALLREGDEYVTKTDRGSLRILGTVGEPINHEAWHWYYETIGNGRCPIIDTWWQTETGGHAITPLPSMDLKPGAATKPFFGIKPVIIDRLGDVLDGPCQGTLLIADSWPGQMRTLYNDHERFIRAYFAAYPGYYLTGDRARRDEDGYYWIVGRTDDVLNVSGHRLGTAELESAINESVHVTESAVVGCKHPVKGQGIYAFVTLREGLHPTPEIEQDIIQTVRRVIGPIATPDLIQFADDLPKTRSGKIMRRILRKIVAREEHQIGDTSTLGNPEVIDILVRNRKN